MYSLVVSGRVNNERLPWDVDRYMTIFSVRLGVEAGLSYSSTSTYADDCRGSTALCRMQWVHEPGYASHVLHPLLGMRKMVVRL